MNIILTGIDGYMGWPTALKIAKAYPNSRIIGIDNFARRKWVEESGSTSIIPILPMEERLKAAYKAGFKNISFIEGDLADTGFVYQLVGMYKPEIILHLAAQPSAPYSQIDINRATYTQNNNISMTRNLLWALKDYDLVGQTHFVETTTTGIYGAPNINIGEGFVEVVDKNGKKDKLPYPNLASSWYHVSKGFDAENMRLMHLQTNMTITDIRTSIVYGTETDETKDNPDLATRFDVDFFFGTLYNRWVAMVIAEYPLAVYGTGNQIKPFISLDDACSSILKATHKYTRGEFRVLSQLTEYIKIKEMAEQIAAAAKKVTGKEVPVNFIPNPRVEREDTEYGFENQKFLEVLGEVKYPNMFNSLPQVLETLNKYKETLLAYKDRFVPENILNKEG